MSVCEVCGGDHPDMHARVGTSDTGHVVVQYPYGEAYMTPAVARRLAMAMIACADELEPQTK